MKHQLIILLSFFSILSCHGEENDEIPTGMKDITINNFPVLDASDSTSPLRYILMCKLLGFDYEWQASPFIQNPDEAPKQVVPFFTCSEDERRELMTKRLLNSNTHKSFMNLIDDEVEVIITARSISRDEKAYADEQGVTLIEKPIARDALAFMVNLKNPVNNLSIEQDTAGIAFTPFYYYKVMVGSGSTKAIGVNGVAMTKENIKNDSYPYTSNVYTAVRSDIDKSSVAYRLFEFLTTEEGQAIVDESGYVSLQTASTGIRSLENESRGIISGDVAPSGKDAPVYNLSGQRLKAPNKGINIIGNKKLIAK